MITAQLRGARKYAEVRETLATLLTAGVFTGVMIGLVYILFGEWLLSLLTTDLFRAPAARSGLPAIGYGYLWIIGLGMPALVVAHIAMYMLQALGNTRAPMRLALYGNVLNAVGNYLLLFGAAIPGVTEPWFTRLGLPGLTLLVALLTPLFLQLYDITDLTRERVIWMVAFSVLYSVATALTMIIPGILRAGGDTRAPMVITFLGFVLVGAPVAWIFGLYLGLGLWGVFAGFVADEVVKAVIMVLYLRRETWLRRLA